MKKLRLMITNECDRNCEGCCNKQYVYSAIPIVESLEGYDEIMITGGEPMLFPDLTTATIRLARRMSPGVKVYLYTTATRQPLHVIYPIICDCDGICFTLHEQQDVRQFLQLAELMRSDRMFNQNMSLRCNVFKGVILDYHIPMLSRWDFKTGMEWVKNCPLPEGEELRRLPELIRYYV